MRSKVFRLVVVLALIVATTFWWSRSRRATADANPVRTQGAPQASSAASEFASADLASSSADVAKAAAASSNRPSSLFTYLPRHQKADTWERELGAPADAIAYVAINRETAIGKKSPFWKTGDGGHLDIVLPNGASVPVTIEHTEAQGADGFVSEGRIEGQPYGRALFAYYKGEMSAVIETSPQSSWQLRARGDGVAQLFQVDVSKVPPCGVNGETNDPQKIALLQRLAAASARTSNPTAQAGSAVEGAPTPTSTADTSAGAPNVTILFAYTDAVAAGSSADAIRTQAQLAVAILNSDLGRSKVDVTTSLVGCVQVSYDESKSAAENVLSDALDRLANTNDGYMDNIHALRDQYGADLVSLGVQRQDSNLAGIAYVMNTPGNAQNASVGFSVVSYSVMTTQSVFSHEIGHNFGCTHDREHATDPQGNSTPGAYSYSYGYRFNGADGVQYRTIMAYAPGNRVAYFSTPDVTAASPVSRPVGIAAGQPGEADNARTIRQDALEVSNFRRDALQAVGNAGILINVSTRAFVGPGAQQLIGGFVIGGTQSKRVLVRAIGPTLAQYGVGDGLADPTLRLVRLNDGVQMAQNDNWGTGPNATTVAQAMTQANAFALPSGSKDAALVALLAPGAYTANVEGVNGLTGTALIEAYDLDSASGRVANLSTRGYADKDKPMIGGFVIQADPAHPGQTKRVVVRVLGPSLANYGISGVMNDPTFELHNGSGAQILQNDDWSTHDQVGTDDTKPAAVTYTEQQLAATGFAPPNRRESAVLVDLNPGAYTAVVKPFEKLPDEPQAPGVALVEVYEILP